MTLPVPVIDVIRAEYERALVQLTARFAARVAMAFHDVLIEGSVIEIKKKVWPLRVTPRMTAEDCLEETLSVLMYRKSLVPFFIRYKKTTLRAPINLATDKKRNSERQKAACANELAKVGVHMDTAIVLARFLIDSPSELIQHLRSFLPRILEHELQPPPGP